MLYLKIDEAFRVAFYGPEESLPNEISKEDCIVVSDANNDIMLGMDSRLLDENFRLKQSVESQVSHISGFTVSKKKEEKKEVFLLEAKEKVDNDYIKNSLSLRLSNVNIVKQLVWLCVILDNNPDISTVNIEPTNIDISMFQKRFPHVCFSFKRKNSNEPRFAHLIDLIDYPDIVKWLFTEKTYTGAPSFVIAPYGRDNVRASYLAEYFLINNYETILFQWGDKSLSSWADRMFLSQSPYYWIIVSSLYEPFCQEWKLWRFLDITGAPFIFDAADNYVDFPNYYVGQSSSFTLKNEKWICDNALEVFASAPTVQSLIKKRHGRNAVLALNGSRPISYEKKQKENAVVLIGSYHDKYDTEFLECLIKNNPDIRFDIYGHNWKHLKWNYSNLRLLNFTPVEEIELTKYKAGLILFKPEKYVSEGMLPLKAFNYIFADIPIYYNYCPELEIEDFRKVSFKSDKFSFRDVVASSVSELYFQDLKQKYNIHNSFKKILNKAREDCLSRYGIESPEIDKIIYLEHDKLLDKSLKIHVDLGLLCNYKCEYCFQRDLEKKDADINKCLEVAKNIWKVKPYMDKIGVTTVSFTLMGGETTLYPVIAFLTEAKKHIKINAVTIITNVSMPNKVLEIHEYCKNNDIVFAISASYHASQTSVFQYIENIQTLQKAEFPITPYAVVNNQNFETTKTAIANLYHKTGLLMLLGRERKTDQSWAPLDTWQRVELSSFHTNKSKDNTEWLSGKCVMKSGRILCFSAIEEIYNVFGFENISTKNAVCDCSHRIVINRDGLVVFGSISACNKKIFNILTDDKFPLDIDGCLICPVEHCPCSCGSSVYFKE